MRQDQDELRARILADGHFYVVKKRLRGETWPRTTIIAPRTTRGELARLIDALRCAPSPG